MNTAYYRQQRARLKAEGVDNWQLALYLEELQTAPFTRDVLENAEMVYGLNINGDYSYVCHKKWDANFALVGDASAFIDPIFSTGVYMAMTSSRIAADAIDVRLKAGAAKSEQAFEEAYESITGAYDLIDKLIRLFYTPESINFAQLAAADTAFDDFDHYRDAMSTYHFLIAGDFFDRPAYYNDFVETLRDEKMFSRYKKTCSSRRR